MLGKIKSTNSSRALTPFYKDITEIIAHEQFHQSTHLAFWNSTIYSDIRRSPQTVFKMMVLNDSLLFYIVLPLVFLFFNQSYLTIFFATYKKSLKRPLWTTNLDVFDNCFYQTIQQKKKSNQFSLFIFQYKQENTLLQIFNLTKNCYNRIHSLFSKIKKFLYAG